MPAAKKRTASPAQLRALARGRAKLKAARRRAAKPKRKTRAKNPAPIPRGLMRKRALGSNLKAGTAKTKERGRMTNPVYKGYVVATFAPRSQRVVFFDGKNWGAHKDALVFGLKNVAVWAAERYGKPAVVTSVNTAAADIRLKLIGE